MVTLQKRLAVMIDRTNDLLVQRCQLEQLREQVRNAELREAQRQTLASLALNQTTNRSEQSSV